MARVMSELVDASGFLWKRTFRGDWTGEFRYQIDDWFTKRSLVRGEKYLRRREWGAGAWAFLNAGTEAGQGFFVTALLNCLREPMPFDSLLWRSLDIRWD